MKNIFFLFSMILCLAGYSQNYYGIFGPPNGSATFIYGNATNVDYLYFTADNAPNVNPPSGIGSIAVKAEVYGYRMVNAPSEFPATNPHPEVMFGGQSNDGTKELRSKPVLVSLSDVSSPSSSYFKPTSAISGMSTTSHYAFEHYISTERFLQENSATDGSYFVGTITYTFSRAVNNPIFHVIGLGGYFYAFLTTPPYSGPYTQLFSTDMEFIPNANATSISRLSGTSFTALEGNTIKNTFAETNLGDPGSPDGASGNSAGTGSFQIHGTGITTVSFNFILRGKIANTLWSTPATGVPGDPNRYTGDRFNTTWTLEPNALPVKLTGFEAVKKGNATVLTWASATEENFSHYEVQRSKDGVSFEGMGTVIGTGSGSEYSHLDANPFSGFNYYRLKVVDVDGSFVYSNIRAVSFETERSNELEIFPNPFHDGFTINGLKAGDQVQVFDLTGKLVFRQTDMKDQVIRVELHSLEPGLYNVLVVSGKEVQIRRLLKVE